MRITLVVQLNNPPTIANGIIQLLYVENPI